MTSRFVLYRVGRFVLGPLFKFYYNPKIIGKENLNVKGPVIIASNHIHLFDQCHTIISTKEIIIYLAKKEYFDSKKNAWFFKSVGCIPVDRTKKDKISVTKAIKVLKNDEFIGIFPEGTRNALKEEKIKEIHKKYFRSRDYKKFRKSIIKSKIKLSQYNVLEELLEYKKITRKDFRNNIFNIDAFLHELMVNGVITENRYYKSYLLDFKYGAVSMAKKTNSLLIPVAITGDYKFRSKNLTVRYGNPINLSNMDLTDANRKLFNTIKEMIYENKNT